ncbi:SusC/RagA family TonB-linked outer membrane protein [Sphingobacterium sp. SGL-16]|uniref:SusC/RagA family TonB-linked outer membrane protein n=1 Tax=Sphingobacterium sp. SGL-16 TaxID=2710883 RepID=UPI0013EA4043|nr:SusC/RagA family TonB-linked outer membrane protein [Sphingobacterium sp. SGL-16]NGM73840.1 SusC/RagA family TonB-linked outer membrane protein [Sphingobacterium sp. SGL-16]
MKIRIALFACFFFIFCFTNAAFAQALQISGNVKVKSSGTSLAGASISVQNTNYSNRTDEKGNYTLSIDQNPVTIVVSYVGMETQMKLVTASGIYDFELDDESNVLADVVVVGYGSQKITKVSGAISTVKADAIDKLKPMRAEEALQGLASGVNVIQSGSPGSKPTVLVRGIPSFSGTDPVVIVDGVPQSLTDFNSISPSDIESINVLKDAATTAIYGVKGGNGVIVVTTKSGRKNQSTDFLVNTNYGFQNVINKVGVLNATEYAGILNEGSTVSGGNIIFPDLSSLGKGTDWQDQVFEPAPVQNHSLSARGGSEKTSYFISTAYQSQGGIVGGYEKSRFNRGTFTGNLDFELSSKLRLLWYTTGVLLSSRSIQENSFNSILGSALNFDPTVAIYNNVPGTVGTYGFSNLIFSEIFNPLTKLENTHNRNAGFKLYGKFELQYKILDNLTLSSRFGYTKYDGDGRSFNPLVFYGPLNVENTMNADGSTVTGRFNSVSHDKSSNFNYTWETYANYNFKIQDSHNFESVFGFSLAQLKGNGASASRQDVPFNSWEFANFASATGINTATNTNALSGSYYQYFRKNLSYFGRLNYEYQDKYLASITARRDGSYAFGPENKFANFYSGSLGWVISQEDFFNSETIDLLKFRSSYGVIGNENVSPQATQIETGGPSYGSTQNSNGYSFGEAFYPGSTLASAVNNALRWEQQKQFNIGFDISILQSKLSLSADYFRKDVDGLLFTPTASLYLGTVPIPTANIGSTQSRGVDLNLSYNETIGNNFKLGNSFNFTTCKNLVTATNEDGTAKIWGGSYFNGQSQSVTVFEKGQTPGYFYGYVTDGLFQNTQEIEAHATQQSAVPGDIRFADLDGDGEITTKDQTKIGDPFPDFTLGWNITAAYKNFDLNIFTYGSFGNDIYRAYERNGTFTNKFRDLLGRWTGENTTNDSRTPRYTFVDANNNARASDRYVDDGTFVKIKNIQLGYTFSNIRANNIFKSIRLYAQVRNALTLTKYTGFDPEISGGILETGVDRGSYPQARTVAVGLDIKL